MMMMLVTSFPRDNPGPGLLLSILARLITLAVANIINNPSFAPLSKYYLCFLSLRTLQNHKECLTEQKCTEKRWKDENPVTNLVTSPGTLYGINPKVLTILGIYTILIL